MKEIAGELSDGYRIIKERENIDEIKVQERIESLKKDKLVLEETIEILVEKMELLRNEQIKR